MYQLSKKFRFESAHRLAKGYEGKCSNIHGHSWNGSLTIEVKELDQYDFAVDFGIMGKVTKALEELLDHAIFLCSEDKEIVELCEKNKWKTFTFGANPTSETLAKFIFNYCAVKLAQLTLQADVSFVEIEETCTTKCLYHE